jgi:DNA mismatch endonuclease (patch repair protein)
MRAVKSRGNKTTELRFLTILKRGKITGWRRHLPLPGTPDFAFPRERIAVMVHGCFWHGCKKHYRRPSENSDYWSVKVSRNMRRDRRVLRELRSLGWSVMTFWEHDLQRDEYVIKRLQRGLEKVERKIAKKKPNSP